MKRTTRRTVLPKRLQRVQSEAERAIGRGVKAALELLPAGPRKAVKELAGQFEATAQELAARGERVLKVAQKRRTALLHRVEKVTKAFERRGARARTVLAARGTRLAAAIERGAVDVVRPLARRLDLATQSELAQLSKRLTQLERRLQSTRRAAA
jgi:hypothetical protein